MAEGRARGAVEAARNDIDAGRLWKARDRLDGAVSSSPHDVELLLLLGEVLYKMHDLPRAGAAWILTERDDEAARAAVAALYERCGRDETQIRRAIPYKLPIADYPEKVQGRLIALGVIRRPHEATPATRASVGNRIFGAVVVVIAMSLLLGIACVWIVGLADVVRSMGDAFRGKASMVGTVGATLVAVVVFALLFGIPFAGARSIESRRTRNRELAFGGEAAEGMTAIRTGRLEPSPAACFAWGVVGLFVPPAGALALVYSIDAIRAIRLSRGRLQGMGWAVGGAALGVIGLIECLVLILLLVAFGTSH